MSSNGREYREKIATRESYGNSWKELAEEFPNLVVLDADLAAATRPESSVRHIPTATSTAVSAESNMMGVAAGLSLVGKDSLRKLFCNVRSRTCF